MSYLESGSGFGWGPSIGSLDYRTARLRGGSVSVFAAPAQNEVVAEERSASLKEALLFFVRTPSNESKDPMPTDQVIIGLDPHRTQTVRDEGPIA